MKEKEKDKKPLFAEFLKYRGNNLSGYEKNSFEKELQKDPFASEAEEGFSSVDPSLLSSDMADLEKRLASHTGNARRFVWYRIAASVAILMTITTLFFILRNEKPGQIAVNELKETTLEIQIPEVVKKEVNEPAAAPVAERVKELRSDEKSPEKEEVRYIAAGAGKIKTEEIRLADTIDMKAEELVFVAAEQEIAASSQQNKKMAVSAKSVSYTYDPAVVSGKVISSEDNLPVPGATIRIRGTSVATSTDVDGNFTLRVPEKTKPALIAEYIGMKRKEFNATADSVAYITLEPDITSLDEVVITGYGVSAGNERAYENISYTAAEPVTGKTAFNKYIDENIVKPDQSKKKEVVILSFTVKINGIPSDIKVIRSPGKQFSDEAIRLINEGPKWKPATENGVEIEDEVRIRIVFK